MHISPWPASKVTRLALRRLASGAPSPSTTTLFCSKKKPKFAFYAFIRPNPLLAKLRHMTARFSTRSALACSWASVRSVPSHLTPLFTETFSSDRFCLKYLYPLRFLDIFPNPTTSYRRKGLIAKKKLRNATPKRLSECLYPQSWRGQWSGEQQKPHVGEKR